MEITNKFNFPQPLVDACQDTYDKGDADYSVSEIIQPSQITCLKKKYADVLTEDVSDLMYALLGKSVHAILEKSTVNDLFTLAEKRLYATVNGVRISGQIDYLNLANGLLDDYKVMSVWEFIYGLSNEKKIQVNFYDYLLSTNGYPTDRLRIVGIFRDWQLSKVQNDKNYPSRQVVQFPIDKWSTEKQNEVITERLKMLTDGGVSCTEDDRWYTGTKYAVMKDKNKGASKVCDSVEDAEKWMVANPKGKYTIVTRPGVNKRCENYCIVSEYCSQYKKLKEEVNG